MENEDEEPAPKAGTKRPIDSHTGKIKDPVASNEDEDKSNHINSHGEDEETI